MNFRDKLFWQSGLIILVAITGLAFPKLLIWIFILAILYGIVGIGYWYHKSKKVQNRYP